MQELAKVDGELAEPADSSGVPASRSRRGFGTAGGHLNLTSRLVHAAQTRLQLMVQLFLWSPEREF